MDKEGTILDMWGSNPEELVLPQAQFIGKNINILPDEVADKFKLNIKSVINKNKIEIFEYQLEINGQEKFFEARIVAVDVDGNDEEEILVTSRNITDRKKAEARISYLSFHDQMTGLYNWRYFENEIELMNESRRIPISIIMGDLDGLKYINDNYGHKMGDRYIKKAAEAFKSATRAEDVVTRVGGDEIAVILPETGAEIVNKICKRIKNECDRIDQQGELPRRLGISLGCSTREREAQDLNIIYRQADQKMYKNKGRRGEETRD